MFVQIHMLQSMPPGNLNRDETGQPKKCVFGGVTRGRISSQCLKRNIRHSHQFKDAFGDALADRTQYLPRMVGDTLRASKLVPEDELEELMVALAARFKKDKGESNSDESEDKDDEQEKPDGSASGTDSAGTTGQLVFFPQPFARRIGELIADLRQRNPAAYNRFIGRKAKTKLTKDEGKTLDAEIKRFIKQAFDASKSLTVDIGLFGRMTTSDLVVNVEAACQVAHAIGTHETLIESDYFTAMDDRKAMYASTQMETTGAAFLGSGETETFYNANVYYKYLNVDTGALMKEPLSLSREKAAQVTKVLLSAAALATPTGKQNSFAAHSVPELILVEASRGKRPVSYANAFLQAVEGRNLMGESAKALQGYIDSVAAAFAPPDMRRVLLAVGHACVELKSTHKRVETLDKLVESVSGLVTGLEKAGGNA